MPDDNIRKLKSENEDLKQQLNKLSKEISLTKEQDGFNPWIDFSDIKSPGKTKLSVEKELKRLSTKLK